MDELRTVQYIGPYSKREILEVKELFDRLDRDGSGSIDVEEFLNDKRTDPVMAQHLRSMFQSLDADASGSVEVSEYLSVVFPRASAVELEEMFGLMELNRKKRKERKSKERRPLSASSLSQLQSLFKVRCVLLLTDRLSDWPG